MKLVVYCTCPDSQVAERIARQLVEKKLSACVNLLPQVTSVFQWEGGVEQESEVLLLIKSDTQHFAALEESIKEMHPHEVPEIIGVPVATGSADYMNWIDQCLREP